MTFNVIYYLRSKKKQINLRIKLAGIKCINCVNLIVFHYRSKEKRAKLEKNSQSV